MTETLNGLPLMRLHFVLQAQEPLRLEGFTGSTWHGALGHALAQVAPAAFELLYRTGQDDAPRPCVLLPHATPELLPAGGLTGFAVVLVGEAVAQGAALIAAVALLAGRGLGNRRVPATLVTVSHEAADGSLHPVLGPSGAIQTETLIPLETEELAAPWTRTASRRVVLRFDTRLRLKAGNGLLETAPPLRLVLQRQLERLSALRSLYGTGGPLPGTTVRALLEQANGAQQDGDGMRWQDWMRTSGRTGLRMPWGGLTGEVAYRGELGALLPWLALGDWLHVGAKTTFGLGHYRIVAASELHP